MEQGKVADFLRNHPRSLRKEIQDGTGFDGSDATFKRLLKKGVEEGVFIAEGGGRGRSLRFYGAGNEQHFRGGYAKLGQGIARK